MPHWLTRRSRTTQDGEFYPVGFLLSGGALLQQWVLPAYIFMEKEALEH